MVRSILRLNLVVVATLLASSARAEPSEVDRATARALAAEGFRALRKQRYEVARDRFARADALVHAPTLIVDWARALTELGQLVEAQEKYELVLREGVDSKAPRAWQRALENARIELEKLRPRLAWVTLKVSGSNEPNVTIDGVPVSRASLGVRRPLNPGQRYVRFAAPNCDATERVEAFAEAEERVLEVTLTCTDVHKPAPTLAKPEAPAKPPSNASADVHKPSAQRSSKRPSALTYAGFGVGGAGLAVGSVFGVLTLNKRAALQEACENGYCPPGHESSIDSYHQVGTVSVVAFAVGFAGVALGITSLVLESPKAHERVSGPKLRAYVEGDKAGVAGVF